MFKKKKKRRGEARGRGVETPAGPVQTRGETTRQHFLASPEEAQRESQKRKKTQGGEERTRAGIFQKEPRAVVFLFERAQITRKRRRRRAESSLTGPRQEEQEGGEVDPGEKERII